MTKIRKLEHHGRETYAVYYGDQFVIKRPLPNMGPDAQAKWLIKQHKTNQVINEISDINNPVYYVPKMIYINDDEIQLLEERAPGFPLTNDLYRNVTTRQQHEIRHGISSFIVDMNELYPVGKYINHKVASELKFSRLENFVHNKMENWFSANDIRYMTRLIKNIDNFEYETREAWSHGDLNSGNVLYDPASSTLSFIDFAEAGYKYIYRDIFAPLLIDLDICKSNYASYARLHNKSTYPILGAKNPILLEIMKNRVIAVYLKRFIKSADDLRLNPASKKSELNNMWKIQFIQELIQTFKNIEKSYTKR
jgi:hypothetical protein